MDCQGYPNFLTLKACHVAAGWYSIKIDQSASFALEDSLFKTTIDCTSPGSSGLSQVWLFQRGLPLVTCSFPKLFVICRFLNLGEGVRSEREDRHCASMVYCDWKYLLIVPLEPRTRLIKVPVSFDPIAKISKHEISISCSLI